MRIRHEFGTEIVNKKVYENMTKEKCKFYLPMCADCKVTFQPCVGIDKCKVTEKQKRRVRNAIELSEGEQMYIERRRIAKEAKINRLAKWYIDTGFPYHLTPGDALILGVEEGESHKSYRIEIKAITGLPDKKEYAKALGIPRKEWKYIASTTAIEHDIM
jgi:hypothetical protein